MTSQPALTGTIEEQGGRYLISLSEPLDLAADGADEFLRGLQGNILKGHGRDHTAHVFVTFPRDPGGSRSWISSFATSHLTNAAEQRRQTEQRRGSGGVGEPFAMVLLTYQGYLSLGVPDAQIPGDPFFKAGLKKHNDIGSDRINDPPPLLWELGYRSELHAMVLLADDDRKRLDGSVANCMTGLKLLGAATFVERGDKLTYDFGSPRGRLEIEHFGHQDGISNPRLFAADIAEEIRDRGAEYWNPSAPLSLVLVAEPNASDRHGSYMVFRKLEQNVRAFHAATIALAKQLNIDVEAAAGLVVGRRRDGTPMIPTTTPSPNADPNDFNFTSDRPTKPAAARLCPLHSHIRRTNPRGDVPHYIGGPADEAFERSMRIARRGITYGERSSLYDPDPTVQPEGGVGLLFMSFQGDLRQFAIQQAGSDGDQFPYNDAFTGLESVIGQPAEPNTVTAQPWPVGDAHGSETKSIRMSNFVKMLGGEYFFASSPQWLVDLVSAPHPA
jgi:Dyp-type peroxidase family